MADPVPFESQTWEQVANRHAPWWLYACDKTGARVEVIKDPQSESFVLRHGATSTGSVTLPAKHDRTADLMADGARYELRSTLTGDVLSTGTVRGDQGQARPDGHEGGQIGTSTWTLVDDHAKLSDWLVFPASMAPNRTVRAPAETVAKTLIGEACTRLGIPHHIPASSGRGDQVTLTGRYQSLADVLYPAVTNAGIGITVRWDAGDARYVIDCYEPSVWPRRITAHSGVVDEWSWSRSYPGATRAVVLGPREGIARLQRTVTDTALEAALGTVREVVVDARDIGDVDAAAVPPRDLDDVHADMDARGQQALDDAVRTVGLQVGLAALPEFAYGREGGLSVGDVLETQLVPTRPVVHLPVSEVHLSWTVEAGFTVTPKVGEFSDSALRWLANRVHELSVGWRRQKASL